MMGIKARAFGPLPPVSLEDLIPPDHVSRQLERSLDLGFVRDLVKGTDANLGRPSIDPVVCFKRPLVLFFEGLRSERQRLRVVADRLRRRWQLGDDLTESLPDHSSLTRLRERSGLEVFRRFFAAIVEQCLAAGLVWGRELDIDATDVAANAAYDSLRPRFAAEAHLARLFPESTTSAAAEDDGPEESGNAEEGAAEHPRPTPLPRALPAAAQAALAAAAAERHDGIGETGHPDRNRASGPSRRVADFWASLTDPDASPLRPTGGRLSSCWPRW